MENLLNYVHLRKDISFKERKLNSVDLLIFSELAYVDFSIEMENGPILLPEACRHYIESRSPEYIKGYFCFSNNIPVLVQELCECPRYANVWIRKVEQCNDDEKKIQFGATLFQIEDKDMIVSYRGTDASMTGWKENMQMTYMDDLPCQKMSVSFFDSIIDEIPTESYLFGFFQKKKIPNFYLTGHSKGGHLAMYTFLNTQYPAQVKKCQVFDAPGFRSSFVKSLENRDIFSQIENIKPQDSIIGCLMEHPEKETVIKAQEEGLLQHDAFYWSIQPEGFEKTKSLSIKSHDTIALIDRLLLSKSDEQKKEAIDLIFSILDRLDITSVSGLNEIHFRQIFQGVIEFKNMTQEERKFMFDIIRFLVSQTASWMKTQK